MIRRTVQTSDSIARLKAEAGEWFLSPSEVDRRLACIAQEFGFAAVGARVSITDVSHSWGECLGEPFVTDPIYTSSNSKIAIYLGGDESARCEIGNQRLSHQLLDAMKSVWAKEFRNDHGGLNLKSSGAGEVFQASLHQLADLYGKDKLAVAYLDLDRFKKVNDQCGHEEGNRALRAVYAEMHQAARDMHGLAFFDGGDEFILVLPTDQRMEIASGLWRLRRALQDLRFGPEKLTIDVTAGVVIRTPNEICNDVKAIKSVCEALTKAADEQKTKRRGTITFEESALQESIAAPPVSLENFFEFGISLSRSRQFLQAPFPDERLNLIADHVEAISESRPTPEKLAEAIELVLSWFGVKASGQCTEQNLFTAGLGGTQLPQSAITLAVVHGLARAAVIKSWATSDDGSLLAVIWNNLSQQSSVVCASQVLWGDCEAVSEEGRLAYGPLVTAGTPGKQEGAVVGIQLGFDRSPLTPGNNSLPPGFFLDHVRVDQRPRSGGGLPDFWQVAVAQVISALGKSTSPAKVLIWGHDPKNTETYLRLNGNKDWSVDEVSVLTGLPTQKISELKLDLPKRIRVTSSPTELLKEIYTAYQNFTGRPDEKCTAVSSERPVLQRGMASAIPLAQSEGIVCRTAAHAYPIIIDTLRKTEDARLSRDDSDQELRELIAFKLKLTAPLESPIPSYLKQQVADLDEYARHVFLEQSEFIRLQLEESNQVSSFVAHLSTYINSSEHVRSTRRACMVVPHTPKSAIEPKPLGLISVWGTPRLLPDGHRAVDFVFVWRTVEAFIGLPYSLYGSIKFAEELVRLVAEQSKAATAAKFPHIGELTYIALSLHLGSDEFHMRVAKRIVDSASD